MPLEYRTNYIRSVYSPRHGSAKVLAYIRADVCIFVARRYSGVYRRLYCAEPRQNGVSRLFVIRNAIFRFNLAEKLRLRRKEFERNMDVLKNQS